MPKQRLQELGVQLDSEAEINAAFAKFKELADRKSEIFDEDILALVSDESVTRRRRATGWFPCSNSENRRAAARRSRVHRRGQGDPGRVGRQRPGGRLAQGHRKPGEQRRRDGPVFVNAISGSTESQGEVTVRLQNSGRVVNGVGADPDIVVASAKAYLSALNKLRSKVERVAAQGGGNV